ncbi:MAG TPA: isoaspartyl peptidase/L-asparaginase [Gemmatimonadaceae bacterium]|nr:isoaspartyl peptidase/L-asparaginase [Gemmatimonadaceae bacterium]
MPVSDHVAPGCAAPRRSGTPVRSAALLSALAAAAACATAPAPAPDILAAQPGAVRVEWGMVIHGGAGSRTPPNWSAQQLAAREAAIAGALRAGHAILAAGGSGLDAVQAAIVLLEDDSTFNAGRGAVLNAEGGTELDAAIMDGPTLRVGTVAGVQRVKNPILLARAVMERSEHVMMIGDGAEQFARLVDVELVDPGYFRTQAAVSALEREQASERRRRDSSAAAPPAPPEGAAVSSDSHYGTVGAVALDRQGRLAAGTSTGGRTNKRYGRVGDVPIIGAGTYANAACGISATGHGEWFIRYTVARDICVGVEYRGQTIAAAADSMMFQVLDPIPVDGGVIGMDRQGRIAMSFNTASMPRGYIGPDGAPRVWLVK